MANSGPWRTFNVQSANVPTLLVKACLDLSGSRIFVSDLRRVWAEKLDKKELVKRAVESGCSIDPSADEDQYNILLGKIRSALDNEPKTSASIAPGLDQSDNLVLNLSAPLPAPLPPLKWSVTLHPLPFDQVGSLLITPLLQYSNALQDQIRSLISELHDKDRVISKITDRLETSGNDLTTVFPGTSNIRISRKRPQREQLGAHIAGLAEFNAKEWRANNDTTEVSKILSKESLNAIFENMPIPASTKANEGALNGWWRDLNHENSLLNHKSEDRSSPVYNDHAEPDDTTMFDDEFQRQATPPKTRQVNPSSPTPTATGNLIAPEDESTADEDSDLDAPSKTSASSKAPPALRSSIEASGSAEPTSSTTKDRVDIPFDTKPRPKLGSLGGKKKAPSPPVLETPPPEKSSQPKAKLGRLGGKSKSSPTQEPTPELPKPKSRLGTLGGKSKTATLTGAPESAEAQASPPQEKASKIGIVGAKREQGEDGVSSGVLPAETVTSSRSRPIIKEESVAPRETSQERADRKRDELKRGLEQKAKAPVRKKRKF